MNEVTRYKNQLNTVPMRKWTPEEQDFFFAIITEARDKGTDIIEFDKYSLAELAGYTIEHNHRFEKTMDSLEEKLSNMRYREKTKNSLVSIPLFQYFEAHWSDDLSEMTLKVQVSSKFDYVLNKLEAEFTQFELKQFTNIRSTYAKEMFKQLKQWRTLGKKEYLINDFREILQIPESYGTKEINTRVLEPIRNELPNYFQNLKVKPIKARKRGNPVTAYEFSWIAEKTSTWNQKKYSSTKKTPRTETLPDWAQDNYQPPKVDTMTPEQQEIFEKKLAEKRANWKNKNK
ncbi:RepB family plasmid replication initiator protein [Marinilactibacillus psychrotolerans]|uniref:Plasmid replication initiation protein n=1 Tax=Marinilactibacillus psychrotolerans 42ea TaxID=1255609 RepID=A0A1R4IMF5_9LACT|nr:replication initiation protein [Marinilactibacillus psychrotolerans]GEQ34348.1 hypothetical protein B795N_22300 [Marinilactibacillus psychrotolerans]SJN20939.1 Plasmid replication initiation protein [Marinilactibacillus psychrotolerans 42ea]